MKRLTWKELRAIAEAEGFSNPRTKGDHYVMSRPGTARPVVIKMDDDLGDDIIQSNKRTMGLSTKDFEKRLGEVRGKSKKKKN